MSRDTRVWVTDPALPVRRAPDPRPPVPTAAHGPRTPQKPAAMCRRGSAGLRGAPEGTRLRTPRIRTVPPAVRHPVWTRG